MLSAENFTVKHIAEIKENRRIDPSTNLGNTRFAKLSYLRKVRPEAFAYVAMADKLLSREGVQLESMFRVYGEKKK